MPSQVNHKQLVDGVYELNYIPPNYRPNYRVPQTRTVRTPAQPNPRDTYDYLAEQRELNRVRQEQIDAANRRMQALMAQTRAQRNIWTGQNYRDGYDPYNTRNNEYVGPRWGDYAYNPAYPKGYNWQYPGGKYYRQPKEPAAPTFNTGIYHTQAEWDAYRKSLNKPATKTTPPTYTRNLPESLQDAIARGEQSPWGYDSGAPATPWNYNPNKYGGVGRNTGTSPFSVWSDLWNIPASKRGLPWVTSPNYGMLEANARFPFRSVIDFDQSVIPMGLTPRYSTLSPAFRDPWAGDPYEIGGSPYAESVYNEQYAEDTGWDGYGGWGGGWGGGGGSYSSSPGIYGDSVRKNQWYSTLLQWNIT